MMVQLLSNDNNCTAWKIKIYDTIFTKESEYKKVKSTYLSLLTIICTKQKKKKKIKERDCVKHEFSNYLQLQNNNNSSSSQGRI